MLVHHFSSLHLSAMVGVSWSCASIDDDSIGDMNRNSDMKPANTLPWRQSDPMKTLIDRIIEYRDHEEHDVLHHEGARVDVIDHVERNRLGLSTLMWAQEALDSIDATGDYMSVREWALRH